MPVTPTPGLPAGWERTHDRTEIDADQRGAYAVACWCGPYATLLDFTLAVGGRATRVGAGTGSVVRVVPMAFPDFPGSTMLADSVRIKADGVGSTVEADGYKALYGIAFVEVTFRTPSFDTAGPNAFRSVELYETGRYLNVPSSLGAIGAIRPTQDVGIEVAGFEVAITSYQLPDLDEATYAALGGTVNATQYGVYAAGTLRYKGPRASLQRTIWQVTSYQITHVFEWSSVPWNDEAIPGAAGTPFGAFLFNDGSSRYATADFSLLFP